MNNCTVKSSKRVYCYLITHHSRQGHVVHWTAQPDELDNQLNQQVIFSGENFILGVPRLRQIRVHDHHCRLVPELSVRSLHCHAPYHKAIEHRDTFITLTDHHYNYTSSKETAAFDLSNVHGPYDTGGFIHQFLSTKQLNTKALDDLRNTSWLDLGTRAVVIEWIYFNPNNELITSINILFEFLTTGKVERATRRGTS